MLDENRRLLRILDTFDLKTGKPKNIELVKQWPIIDFILNPKNKHKFTQSSVVE